MDLLPDGEAVVKTAAGRWGPLAAAVAAYWTLTFALLMVGLGRTGGVFVYAQDDPYIHLTIARTLAIHGVWGIRADEFASASSSPLWTALLAVLWKVGARATWWPLVLNLIAGAGTLSFAHEVLRPRLLPIPRFLALMVLTAATPLPTLALIGMEHSLQILLVLALVWVATGIIEEEARSRIGLLCLLAALLAATRYEGLLVVGAAAAVMALNRRYIAACASGLASLAPVVLFGVYSTVHGALPLPNSVLMKSGPGRFATLGSGIAAVASDWLAVLNIFGRPPVLTLTIAVLLALAFMWTAHNREDARIRNAGLIFLASVTLHVCLVKIEWFFRYEAYLVALGILTMALACSLRMRGALPRLPQERTMPASMLAILLCLPVAVRSLSAVAVTPGAMRNVFEQQYQMGLFFRGAYPGDPIAVNDIGAVGWLSPSPIVDIVGLATKEVADLKRHRRFDGPALERLIAVRGVRAVAMYEKVFEPIIPRSWTLVGEWTIANNVGVSEDTVGFYAPTPADVTRLRGALDAFATALPGTVKYTAGPR